MKNILFRLITVLTFVSTLPLSTYVFAGDDPSIKGDLRANIVSSMSQFVNKQTINGKMHLYDAVAGNMLNMEFIELHKGIVNKEGFYVSCADFKDQHGRAIDVDFLVLPSNGKLITTQGVVHSINGDKRDYHLEKM